MELVSFTPVPLYPQGGPQTRVERCGEQKTLALFSGYQGAISSRTERPECETDHLHLVLRSGKVELYLHPHGGGIALNQLSTGTTLGVTCSDVWTYGNSIHMWGPVGMRCKPRPL
jgi:hypothetical protein